MSDEFVQTEYPLIISKLEATLKECGWTDVNSDVRVELIRVGVIPPLKWQKQSHSGRTYYWCIHTDHVRVTFQEDTAEKPELTFYIRPNWDQETYSTLPSHVSSVEEWVDTVITRIKRFY